MSLGTGDLPVPFSLVLVQVFFGDVVLGHFAGANFLTLAFSGLFDAGYDSRLEGVALFQQFVHTFGIDTLDVR